MNAKNNWIEDWNSPPTSEEQLDAWRIYTVLWKECDLTPPGMCVRRWLLMYGNPNPENYLDRYFQQALDIYLYPPPQRRHA